MSTHLTPADTSFAAAHNDIHRLLHEKRPLPLPERLRRIEAFIHGLKTGDGYTYYRPIRSATGREVTIWDEASGRERTMLMFASNNYLGFANHPYVRERVDRALDQYGVGVGGPPLLNGYTGLMQELEERLARLKKKEAAMVFSSGFAANLGLVTGLAQAGDLILYDELSHASLNQGLRETHAASVAFRHNDLGDLADKLRQFRPSSENLFVAVEGVYSMDGDLAPLDGVVELCRQYDAYLWLDDAHGTGVLGAHGSGTAELFGVSEAIDVSMGTFSKAFAVTGGFLAASRECINYLRYFARPYLFSAALPPMTLAAVLAGLDLIESAPELRHRLLDNVRYARERLRGYPLQTEPGAAILALRLPPSLNIRRANYLLHQQGVFLNAIEYPAVPLGEERFRISFCAEHTRADIDRLVAALDSIWPRSAGTSPRS